MAPYLKEKKNRKRRAWERSAFVQEQLGRGHLSVGGYTTHKHGGPFKVTAHEELTVLRDKEGRSMKKKDLLARQTDI